MIDSNYAGPDYIERPFTAEWGTPEWIADAKARVDRARSEFAKAAECLMVEQDIRLSLALAWGDLREKADNLCRAKWLQRELIKAIERQPPSVRIAVVAEDAAKVARLLLSTAGDPNQARPVPCPSCGRTGKS